MGGTQTDVKAALDDAANQADQVLAENKAKYGDTPGSSNTSSTPCSLGNSVV